MLKTIFENLEHGWCDLNIIMDAESIFEIGFSYTPYDTFADLINALRVMKSSAKKMECKVKFSTEPIEYEFQFYKNDNIVSLKIFEHEDYRRIEGNEILRVEVAGKFEEICLPFWRGLRKLQSADSEEELNERWHRYFPSKEITSLGEEIKRVDA